MGRLNKPAQPGYRYRSPNQTNAEDLFPNLQEDVIASQRADIERVRKGLNPTANSRNLYNSDINLRRQQEAGGRATLRSVGRAGLAGTAFEAGRAVGEEIDRRNPKVGEAAEALIEKSGVGALARRGAVSPGRVELTDEARQQLIDKEVDEAVRESNEKAAEKRAAQKMEDAREKALRRGANEGYAKGGMVSSASKRGDGIAQRGKTRGKVY